MKFFKHTFYPWLCFLNNVNQNTSIPTACQISEAEKVALQKIYPRFAIIYRLAKQMQGDNHCVF